MPIKAVLFDLDGTLLPMDQDAFVNIYFRQLARHLAPRGYDPEKLIAAIWQGTKAMVKNDGQKSNEAVFWDLFAGLFGEDARKDEPHFDAFYRTAFGQARDACGYTEKAAQLVKRAKEAGLRTVLATNPIFPDVATSQRIQWAGLKKEDFEWYTTYENARFCKPNPAYYGDILEKLGLKGEECLMIGNDALEDGAAAQLGMKVFIIRDCLLNEDKVDCSRFAMGGFDEAMAFVEEMAQVKE